MNTNQPTALSATDADGQIKKLQAALADAEAVAKLLLSDPHFGKCPFVAAIRGPIVAGIDRIEHLVNWLDENPVKETVHQGS